MQNKVSIIVPVYNTQDFLNECVESLLNQDYENIEIILIDDCSRDDSSKICRSYAQQDSRIKFIAHEKNFGQEKSRNDGINNASGDWIMFCDSDDIFSPDAVGRMKNFASENNLNVVLSSFYYWQDNNSELDICEAGIKSNKLASGVYTTKQIAEKLFVEISFGLLSCIGSKIYSKKFINENNIRFNIGSNWGEDTSFIIKCLSCSNEAGSSPIIPKPF